VEREDGSIAVTLSWTNPPDGGAPITGYKLYKSDTNQEYSLIFDGSRRADITTYTHTNLEKGQVYYYKVTALNAAGESDPSDELEVLAASTPSQPTNFQIDFVSSGSITASWSAPLSDGGSRLTGYILYYKEVTAAAYTAASPVVGFSDTLSLTGDLQYFVKVVATNSLGEGKATVSLSAYASDKPTILDAPDILGRGSTSLTIEWTITSTIPVLATRVYANRGDGANPDVLVAEVPMDRTIATITDLEEHSYMSFNIIQKNAAGWSDPSPLLTTRIGKLPAPPSSAPTLVGSTQNSIEFEWEPSPEPGGAVITGYKVWKDGVEVGTTAWNVLSDTIGSLTAGDEYSISISAITSIGEGDLSPSATFTAVDTPDAPTLSIIESGREG
jgi:hypothetical protein